MTTKKHNALRLNAACARRRKFILNATNSELRADGQQDAADELWRRESPESKYYAKDDPMRKHWEG